ncbi:MAG: hypothetical protein WC513_06325 [Bacteroidales bacterium]|nr:hypothetical protein [Bacteroidales bacterium]MDD4474045.1 hypothetical protein [Bacteroidales bacterium]MDD5517622.1 hypothetical protein [Bacteroidales bacterium]
MPQQLQASATLLSTGVSATTDNIRSSVSKIKRKMGTNSRS